MRYLLIAPLALVVLSMTAGCGDSGAGKPTAAATTALAPQSPIPTDPVAQVVYQFLDAVRRGNGDGGASQCLTPLALERINERNMNISPPGSATARFQIGAVEMLDADKAVVDSIWTDLDADGKPYQEPISCALRMCDGQWRIFGMREDMGPNRPPMIMNFETLEALAPRKPVTNQPAAGAPTQPSGPSDQVARDPFAQPAVAR